MYSKNAAPPGGGLRPKGVHIALDLLPEGGVALTMKDSPSSSSSSDPSGAKFLQLMTLNLQVAQVQVNELYDSLSLLGGRIAILERLLANVSISSTDDQAD